MRYQQNARPGRPPLLFFLMIPPPAETNTGGGNRRWMRARIADQTALPGFEGLDPIASDGSDSHTLDSALELMRQGGYSLTHALARLGPPAWERDKDLPPDVRAFYEFPSPVRAP